MYDKTEVRTKSKLNKSEKFSSENFVSENSGNEILFREKSFEMENSGNENSGIEKSFGIENSGNENLGTGKTFGREIYGSDNTGSENRSNTRCSKLNLKDISGPTLYNDVLIEEREEYEESTPCDNLRVRTDFILDNDEIEDDTPLGSFFKEDLFKEVQFKEESDESSLDINELVFKEDFKKNVIQK